MGKIVTLGNGKQIRKDIELCRTTCENVSEEAIHLLVENQIPFTMRQLYLHLRRHRTLGKGNLRSVSQQLIRISHAYGSNHPVIFIQMAMHR